jgi:hypothetical protein
MTAGQWVSAHWRPGLLGIPPQAERIQWFARWPRRSRARLLKKRIKSKRYEGAGLVCGHGRPKSDGCRAPHTWGWRPGLLLRWIETDFLDGKGRMRHYSDDKWQWYLNDHHSLDAVYTCGCWMWGCPVLNDEHAIIYGWQLIDGKEGKS